jgi:hypothetical protein
MKRSGENRAYPGSEAVGTNAGVAAWLSAMQRQNARDRRLEGMRAGSFFTIGTVVACAWLPSGREQGGGATSAPVAAHASRPAPAGERLPT